VTGFAGRIEGSRLAALFSARAEARRKRAHRAARRLCGSRGRMARILLGGDLPRDRISTKIPA
jgi:hypothetical protein